MMADTSETPAVFEAWDCGTHHLSAQRALQIIERCRIRDHDAMMAIEGFVAEAGPEAARRALQDEVPF